MLTLINRIHRSFSYRYLSLNYIRSSTIVSSGSSEVFPSSDEQINSSILNQFIVQQFSWRLSHQPHSKNIRKNSSFIFEMEQNKDISSSKNNWDSWFEKNESTYSIAPLSQMRSISSEVFQSSNLSLSRPTLKRNWNSDIDLSYRNEKRFRQETMRRRDLPQRTWTTTDYNDRMKKSHHEHFSFQIVSYNILAQKLIEDNLNLYQRCANYDLNWSERKNRLFHEILRQNADIICLQEMQDVHYYNEFRHRLYQYGYESIYIKRTGDKTDGCALFYLRNRLKLVRSKTVPFYQRDIEVLNRENCGLIALFQPSKSNSTSRDMFCVANTHLLFSPKRGDIKLAQIQYFLAEIDRLSSKGNHFNSHYPIIFCGDFNAQPQSPLSQFITEGHIKYDDYRRIEISGQIPVSLVNNKFSLQLPSNYLLPPSFVTSDCRFPDSKTSFDPGQSIFDTNHQQQSSAILTHNKRFRSVYDMNDLSKVTTRIDNDIGLVDYIFYTRSTDDRNRLNLLARYELYDQELASYVNLPNHQFPSDHFLLSAKFALRLHKRKKDE